MFQLGHHLRHRLRPILRPLRDHALEDGVERVVGWDSVPTRRHAIGAGTESQPTLLVHERWNCRVLMRHQLLHDRVAVVQTLACQQVVQRTTERIDVAPRIGMLGVHRLFGGHVIDRPHDRPGRSQPCSFGRASDRVLDPRQTHIENLHRPLRVDQQIRRLDVAMNDSLLVSELQSPRRLNDAANGLLNRQRPVLLHEHRQVAPIDVLHHEEVRSLGFVCIVGRDNVRMPQLRRRLDLAMKPLQRVRSLHRRRRHHLERHQPLHPLVLSLEHHPHATLTQLVENEVVPQRQRLPFASVNLLGLKLGELLQFHKLTGTVLAIFRASINRHGRNPTLQLVVRRESGRCQLLRELFEGQRH